MAVRVAKGKRLGDVPEKELAHSRSQAKMPLQHPVSKPKGRASAKNMASEIRIFVCVLFQIICPQGVLKEYICTGAEHLRSAVANRSHASA